MAKMVFGTMAFVMTLFYFVNWPDEDVQKETWGALSDMIAIFCSVLAFSAISTSMSDFAETDPHAHGPPTLKAISISFGRYVVCMAVVEGSLQAFKNKPSHFKYVCTILGHVTGFAAIDAFGSLLQYELFSKNLAVCWIGVISFYVVIAVTAHGISFYTVDKAKGSHHWKHECMEVQSDYVSLCAGLLFSLVIRFSISGVLPPVHGAPRHKTAPMVWGLFSAALLIVPFVLGASMWKYKVHQRHAGSIMLRFSETIQMTLCFATGWTLLYWGYWEFYQTQGDEDDDFGPGGKMLQRLTMAIVFSVIVFACILLLDKIADNIERADLGYALRSLLKTCSLLMGLSWEACFNQGVHAVGLEYEGSTQTVVIVVLSAVTCAVVLPAWAMYILPHTVRGELLKDEKDPLKGFADDAFEDHGDRHEAHTEEGGHGEHSKGMSMAMTRASKGISSTPR
jgi:hypothetical protein